MEQAFELYGDKVGLCRRPATSLLCSALTFFDGGIMEIKELLPAIGRIVPLIESGAFLSAFDGKIFNTMTIGWGMAGVCWRKPVLMVAVRNSRYTHAILENAADFTVSMPLGDLRDEIFYCGTKSGRDVDKLDECGLKTATAQKTATPVIDIHALHAECRIIYKRAMEPALLAPDLHALYPEKDFHTLYYGEVLACYETGSE